MTKKVAFKTLGCRLNQFETDAIVTDFFKAGYQIVKFNEKADVYIVNTCTVTNQSDQKSKHMINQALRTAKNGSVLLVTGCMAESQKEYLKNRYNIDYIVDNKRKSSILQLIDAHYKGRILHPDDLKQDLFNFTLIEKGFHTRSTIKIQDGCDNFCAYCIVPSVRGIATSRPVKDIIVNINQSLELGNKEIVLTGVNISRYESEGVDFENLIEKILNIPGDFRLRISSIEPDRFTDKLFDLFNHPKLCPHLHLCLQSGSDEVLKHMQRFYTIDQYLKITDQLGKRYIDFNFTTDIIVGFPGETAEEFAKTCDIVRRVRFSHIHTFRYSKRTGTRAEQMSGQVSEKIKSERSTIIHQISDANKLAYRRKFIGKEQVVLVERSTAKKSANGYGEHYIPVLISNSAPEKNTFCKVHITNVLDDKDRTVIGAVI